MKDVRLTRKIISDLPMSPASGSKAIAWDIETRGFGAYRTSKNRISFLYQYRSPIDGRPRRDTLGQMGELTVDQARAMAADRAYDVRRGIDPVLERRRKLAEERKRTDLVLRHYAEDYLVRRANSGKPRTPRDTKIIRDDVLRLLGHKRIDQITITDVEAFADELAKRAPSARRTGLVLLKTILNDAKRRNKIDRSPADAVPTPKSGVRQRRLRDWEIQRFYEAARDIGDVRGDILEVLLRTLKRKEEVAELLWEELDIPKAEWHLPKERSKNRQPYLIELPRQVMDIILRQQPDPALRTGPVFTLDGGKTSPEMGTQVKDLLDGNMHRRVRLANARDNTAHRVDHFTVHDLRTTGASRNQEEPLRASREVIDFMLLHVGGDAITRTYQIAQLVTEVGTALQAWNDWLDRMLEDDSSWPGGRDLPKLRASEITNNLIIFRQGWPERADQKRKREKALAAPSGPARGRRAKDAARRRGLT